LYTLFYNLNGQRHRLRWNAEGCSLAAQTFDFVTDFDSGVQAPHGRGTTVNFALLPERRLPFELDGEGLFWGGFSSFTK
jgi:hypothetical protein